VTIAGVSDPFVRSWAILFPLPAEKPAAVPDVTAAVQANVVPGAVLVSAIEVVPPEQKLCTAGVAVISGKGFTVTVTLDELLQPFASLMVTVYTPPAVAV
jgi:hypothetical protein